MPSPSSFRFDLLHRHRANSRLVEAIWRGHSQGIRSLVASGHLTTPGRTILGLGHAHVIDPAAPVGFRALSAPERQRLLDVGAHRMVPGGLRLTAFEAAVVVRRDALAIELWDEARGDDDENLCRALEPLQWAMSVGSEALLKELVRHVPRAQWAAADHAGASAPGPAWVCRLPPEAIALAR